MQRLVTLTTDFGLHDYFAGTMKGVILNINPTAQIVDISHAVQSFDVLDGALTIAAAYSYFAPGTIHVVVVDPGVGTSRRPIVAGTASYLFVAPDNGVLSFVFEWEERVTVRQITDQSIFLQPVSATFQGRDIFAPVAGHLSKGRDSATLGEIVGDYVRLPLPRPRRMGNSVVGVVLRVDKFGNLVTNIRPGDAPQLFQPGQGFRLMAGNGVIRSLRHAFAEGAPGEAFAILGSMGFLEIAANRGSAAELLGAGEGAEVNLALE